MQCGFQLGDNVLEPGRPGEQRLAAVQNDLNAVQPSARGGYNGNPAPRLVGPWARGSAYRDLGRLTSG